MTKDNQNPALKAVKKHRDVSGKEIELSTGVKAILTAVSSTSIFEAQAQITDPPVPVVTQEGKAGEFENPNDPDYREALKQNQTKRIQAGFDTLIILGVELVDGIPEDNKWLGKLKYLEKRGLISLDGYDLSDELDREFLYKKHIAMSSDDWTLLTEMSGISSADIEAAENLF